MEVLALLIPESWEPVFLATALASYGYAMRRLAKIETQIVRLETLVLGGMRDNAPDKTGTD